MQPENDSNGSNPPTPSSPVTSIPSHPRWRRRAALIWVIVFCVIAGGAGLALAEMFAKPTLVETESFSGY